MGIRNPAARVSATRRVDAHHWHLDDYLACTMAVALAATHAVVLCTLRFCDSSRVTCRIIHASRCAAPLIACGTSDSAPTQALSTLLFGLTGVLGDSYVFVQNHIQQAAILTKVRSDLQWLAERCESVVVIAHSQGAAIAHRVLRRADPANVRLLITLGSGLAKLEELEAMAEHPGMLQIAYLSVPLLMLGTIISVRIYFHFLAQPTQLVAFTAVFFPVILVITTVRLVRQHADKTQQRVDRLSLSSSRPSMQWLDLYATCDPVPNGPLTEPGRLGNFESRAVTNTGSILQDHTSYWDNQAEVVPYIMQKISDQLKLGLFAQNDSRLQTVATQHRRWVLLRVGIRWANLCAVLLIILQPKLSGWFGAIPSRKLPAWGEAIQHVFINGLPAALGKSLTFVGQILAWIAGKPIPQQVTILLLGAMVPTALLAFWYLGFRLIWKWLDGFPTGQVSDPDVPSSRKMEPVILKSLVVAAGLVPLILAGIFVVRSQWLETHLEEEFYRGLGYVVAFWLSLSFLAVLVGTAISVVRAKNATERRESFATFLYASVLTLIFFAVLIPSRTLDNLKDLATELLGVVLLLCVMVLSHRSLVKRAGPRTGHFVRWWSALLLPFCPLVFPLIRLPTVASVNKIPAIFLGLYTLGVLISWIVAWIGWIVVKISAPGDHRDSVATHTPEDAASKADAQ